MSQNEMSAQHAGCEARQDIKSMNLAELTAFVVQLGEPKYRSGQVFKWLHRGVETIDEMTDIPKSLREKLDINAEIKSAAIAQRLMSKDGETRKYLLRMNDGEHVEAVLMKYKHGYSTCISTQVGCRMGCTFCATGKSGFSRNLSASEMLAQITAIQRRENIRVSNVVLMGMGEPLDNYDNVMRFLELLSDPDGVGIGMRHISLSTCGLADRIEQLIERKPQFTLSVSLHAPNDELRSRMMPINKKWNVDTLLRVCRRYAGATGRRISFEYSLVSGVNDSPECARELVSRLKGMLCHVNLIPVNSVEGTGCNKPAMAAVTQFCSILNNSGITATVRRTLGSDINASCGQLRRRAEKAARTDEQF